MIEKIKRGAFLTKAPRLFNYFANILFYNLNQFNFENQS
jgi:hypothetical protein